MWIQIVRLSARIIGLFLVGLILLLAIGHAIGGELNPAQFSLKISLMMVALLVSLAGMLLLWRWELLGAVTSVAGILCFYTMNYAASGQLPVGWVFPLYYVPGLLSLFCWGYTNYNEKRRGLQQKTNHT